MLWKLVRNFVTRGVTCVSSFITFKKNRPMTSVTSWSSHQCTTWCTTRDSWRYPNGIANVFGAWCLELSNSILNKLICLGLNTLLMILNSHDSCNSSVNCSVRIHGFVIWLVRRCAVYPQAFQLHDGHLYTLYFFSLFWGHVFFAFHNLGPSVAASCWS
jgi:hypothetical protein